jgi:hypothetical protein
MRILPQTRPVKPQDFSSGSEFVKGGIELRLEQGSIGSTTSGGSHARCKGGRRFCEGQEPKRWVIGFSASVLPVYSVRDALGLYPAWAGLPPGFLISDHSKGG